MNDWHQRIQFLQLGLCNAAQVDIPASSLHVETMDVSSFPGGLTYLLLVLLGDVADQAHLVQRQLVLSGRTLHDRRQEGLWVEEAGQPDGVWKVEVRGPGLQLLDPQEQVRVPAGQPYIL